MKTYLTVAQKKHKEVLEEKVFQVHSKWPQFKLLLDDLELISSGVDRDKRVISLERTLLYDGYSLFAPFFSEQNFLSIDCSPPTAESRGAYNKSMIEDSRFIKVKHHLRCQIEAIPRTIEPADFILVPNLIHHVRDQNQLFQSLVNLLRPGGLLYIFEPTLREYHQIPDDFIRYTPSGMANCLELSGLKIKDIRMIGGPFSAIAYCWTQALEYIPEGQRDYFSNWFYGKHFRELMSWDKSFPINLARERTSFPVAFSVFAHRANDT